MREALSGTSSQRFTVSPASISIFLGFVVWFWGVCFGFFCVGVGLCLCFCLCLPHERDLLSCVRIVCNLERPSELSWRARHGRKKKSATDALPNDVLYVSPTIFTFACDVSISLWLIPPAWRVGILELRHLTLDHCA